MAIAFNTFDSPAAAAAALAQHAATALEAGCTQRQRASLVVSGGRSPIAFFNALSAAQNVPWAQVGITLADERWVEPKSADSNQRLVHTELLQNAASVAQFVPLKAAGALTAAALSAQWQAINNMAQPFDFMVLGMGDDSHTASLFPDAVGLAEALDLDAPTALVRMQPLNAPHERISFNLSALLHSRHIALLLQGSAKRDVYERALVNTDALSCPICAVLQQNKVPVSVYWSA